MASVDNFDMNLERIEQIVSIVSWIIAVGIIIPLEVRWFRSFWLHHRKLFSSASSIQFIQMNYLNDFSDCNLFLGKFRQTLPLHSDQAKAWNAETSIHYSLDMDNGSIHHWHRDLLYERPDHLALCTGITQLDPFVDIRGGHRGEILASFLQFSFIDTFALFAFVLTITWMQCRFEM